MADSALTSDPLERYSAIERAYCEERWMAVIHDGQTLLSDLAHAMTAPPEGLKERLQLLIGHAFLYGLGDRDSAEDLYQAVLRSGAEASLRQIAEQGLQQCVLPVGPAEVEQEDLPESASGRVPAASTEPPEASEEVSWDSPAETTLAVPSDHEPAVGLDPALQQAEAEGWGVATSQAGSTPTEDLGWMTAGTTAAPLPSTAQPVMPWLESGVPAGASSTQPEAPVDAQVLPASQQTGKPQVGSRSPEPDQSWPPLAAQPDPASPVVEAGSGMEPPLSPASAASLAATAAAVAAALQQSEIGLPPEALQIPAALEHLSRASSGGPEAPLPSPAGLEPATGPSASRAPLTDEETLAAEVVDEPELIELHQASERRREEILLEPVAETPSQSPLSSLAGPEAGLPPGLQDRRADDADFGDAPAELAEPDTPPAPAAEEAPASARSVVQRGSGLGPFSAPPQPVAEEDPELLMGLLKVEMG